jgi:hypothetical protein
LLRRGDPVVALVSAAISLVLTGLFFEALTDRDWSVQGWEWPEVMVAASVVTLGALWLVSLRPARVSLERDSSMSAATSEDWAAARAVGAFLLFVAVCAAASFQWIYGSHLAIDRPIRGDATGYYIYLPAAMLDRDITMERTAARSFAGSTSALQAAGVQRVPPRNRYLDKYPLGEAIMLTPFFVLGDAAARVLGFRTDGFSTPYQWAAAAAGLVYALLGLAVLGLLLLRWFSRATVVLTLLAITFGTSLFHYATYDAVVSHAFSFFLVAAILRLALSVSRPGRSLE